MSGATAVDGQAQIEAWPTRRSGRVRPVDPNAQDKQVSISVMGMTLDMQRRLRIMPADGLGFWRVSAGSGFVRGLPVERLVRSHVVPLGESIKTFLNAPRHSALAVQDRPEHGARPELEGAEKAFVFPVELLDRSRSH